MNRLYWVLMAFVTVAIANWQMWAISGTHYTKYLGFIPWAFVMIIMTIAVVQNKK